MRSKNFRVTLGLPLQMEGCPSGIQSQNCHCGPLVSQLATRVIDGSDHTPPSLNVNFRIQWLGVGVHRVSLGLDAICSCKTTLLEMKTKLLWQDAAGWLGCHSNRRAADLMR